MQGELYCFGSFLLSSTAPSRRVPRSMVIDTMRSVRVRVREGSALLVLVRGGAEHSSPLEGRRSHAAGVRAVFDSDLIADRCECVHRV